MSTAVDRKEPELAAAFRKDAGEEDFLRRFNAVLAPHQDEDYRDLPETLPTLHIIGAPRSGTTLLHQVVAAHLEVGYVNNLIAAFWRAPVYGMQLSQKLLPAPAGSSYRSQFGRTEGIQEPHEFGYFWSTMLGYDEMRQRDAAFEATIDWDRLAMVLRNMTDACARPMVFKPLLAAWHVARLQQTMPRACFLWIRRDPVQTALSMLKFRRKLLGSVEAWGSLKPAEYEWLKGEPYPTQVAGQVVFLERAIARQVEQVDGRNVLSIDYERFTREPGGVLGEIRDLLADNGFRPELRGELPAPFTTCVRTPDDADEYDRVRREVDRFLAS